MFFRLKYRRDRNMNMKQLQCVAQTLWMCPRTKTSVVKWKNSLGHHENAIQRLLCILFVAAKKATRDCSKSSSTLAYAWLTFPTNYKPWHVVAFWWPQIWVCPVVSTFPRHPQQPVCVYWTRTREQELQQHLPSMFDTRLESYGPKSWKRLSDCSYDEQHPHSSPTKCL